MKTHKRALILNADYLAYSIVDWRKALVISLDNGKDGADIIKYYDDIIHDSKGREHILPSVIRLRTYIKRKQRVPFSRKNVFLRDQLTCMYCGGKFDPENLTYDHVVPRSKWDQSKHGTPTKWENIVTCCVPCNRKKGNRTLEQSKMRLLKRPECLANINHVAGLSPWSYIEPEWEDYLPPLYKSIIKNGV
jgi:5-methylcytosine-specific restriction endonuclease McrA